MPRSKSVEKRIREPDHKYKSKVVAKMISMIMKDGKKSLAQRIVYGVMENLNPDDPKEARRFFEEAVKNVMPDVEVRSRRVGGANYQIPVPVRHDRAETLALRWIIEAAKSRKGVDSVTRLTEEIKDAFNNEGKAITKKINTHKMAEANKAFAHFRW